MILGKQGVGGRQVHCSLPLTTTRGPASATAARLRRRGQIQSNQVTRSRNNRLILRPISSVPRGTATEARSARGRGTGPSPRHESPCSPCSWTDAGEASSDPTPANPSRRQQHSRRSGDETPPFPGEAGPCATSRQTACIPVCCSSQPARTPGVPGLTLSATTAAWRTPADVTDVPRGTAPALRP